jgi:tRNA pseudouridine38-40 synthase
MQVNLKFTVRYDGTDFAGWQVQPDQRTVQGELERVLSQIASQPIRITGASRTDAGVHALGQVFSCHWPRAAEPQRLAKALSKMLRPEIRIENAEEAPPEFDARKSARGKRYAYTLSLTPHADPFSARYAWHVPWPVDVERLAALARRFEGEHDFAGLQAGGAAPTRTTVRTLHSVRVREGGTVGPCDAKGLFHIEFHGDGFLYKMIRNVTGTLVDSARGIVPEGHIDELLVSPGPYHGHTAPPHGLTLLEVEY